MGIFSYNRAVKCVFIAFFFCACTSPDPHISRVEKHTIIDVFQQEIVEFSDYYSPKYRAILDNQDTIGCTYLARVGDTVLCTFYKTAEIQNK